jgi:hypothetical protein
MKKLSALIFIAVIISTSIFGFQKLNLTRNNGAPPFNFADEPPENLDPYAWIRDWTRPDGPPKVGLQVGHWKNNELPEELSRLIGNTGSSGGGKDEWEVNMDIAQSTAEILRAKGIQVDILPATLPEKYWADVFIAIHADGSTDRNATGFKISAPRRDFTNRAENLASQIQDAYANSTKLTIDPNVTRNMRGYYAFAWWRYVHAVHPMTTSAILETGFLTNALDRKIIITNSHLSAQGLAQGIISYLESENLLAT